MDQNDLLRKINSGDTELVTDALREIKEEGDLSLIPALLDILDNQSESDISAGIIRLLSDVKDNDFREILINRIQQTSSPKVKSVLLRIVWESTLNYSGNLDLFTDILLQDEFISAFEASTVIENMIYQLNTAQLKKLNELFSTPGFPEDKRFLIGNILEEMATARQEEQESEKEEHGHDEADDYCCHS